MAIERKLEKNPQLRAEYNKFMSEYEALHHMTEISYDKIPINHYFLPHHAVFKLDSTTTKTRVVFDASAKTSTNYSLNDVLATGPTTQADVFTTSIRFRLPRYAFTADIEKMYRQVWVDKEDRKYQLIWWRESPHKPLRCMQLSTITYGTTCAPYLATRTLQYIADHNQTEYPLATNAIKHNFYVDDVLSGSDKISTALLLQDQLRKLLRSYGLNLRKWCANDETLLRGISDSDKEISLDIPGSSTESVKTMGITWFPQKDVFSIKITQIDSARITKRIALADISRLFDPLGLVAPVVVTAKVFLQHLWKLKLDWDAALPQELYMKWFQFRQELSCLNEINIPRHIFNHRTPRDVQIHIFADASEVAYGAAAYVRSVDNETVVIVRLLCSKSRVAPVKQVTLPRLELCAAKLATDLGERLKEDKIFPDCKVFYWTDSTAVLGWINASSSNYHTFIANRISAIQQVSSPQQWHHVRTDQNPADLASRGIMPKQLINNVLWFYGPLFLHAPITAWPLQSPREQCALELRQKVTTATVGLTKTDSYFQTIRHANSLRKLQRIMAYAWRFITNCKHKVPAGRQPALTKDSAEPISAVEMDKALQILVKLSQQQDFAEDIKNLQKHQHVPNSSDISSLSPFIDDNGVLRVGGRLQASNLSFDAKHQILLSYHHSLTKLIFNCLHKENQHVGAQTLLSIVRQRFWPMKGKNIARSTIQSCIVCTKARPKLFQQIMGALPKDRVQPARPFVNAGVDFFGPIWVHVRIRGKQPLKSYVAVFCCFATKAVHLELVSDLSTGAFLGALRRFMARRGHCSKLYCDNATNFVGARNELKELNDILFHQTAQQTIVNVCSQKNVQFSFIPPRAPHFGGLWEAAVKSAKHLLHSTLSTANLTREEMETVLAEAEAIMNSRPLTPMSSDPNDLSALTPGHFLIGEPLTTTVDPNAANPNIKVLTRWKLVSYLKGEFWKRWTNEYLHTLQHRYKWKEEVHNISPGTMVMIKEDNLPAFEWTLGRIKNVIRGEDGLVRVADVQTAKNILRRPIHKLAPLPLQEDLSDTTGTNAQAESSRPTRKRKAVTNVATLLLTCLVLPLVTGSAITTHPFQGNPGIYFERVGMANVISSTWNLVNYFDLRPFWKEAELTQKYANLLSSTCNKIRTSTCEKTVTQIQLQLRTIDATNQLLRHTHRSKRGAFNFVGNVANGLFGILDSEYADKLTQSIESIKQNEETLKVHVQNQTTYLDRTLSIMKKNIIETEKEFNLIEKLLYQTSRDIDNLTQQMHDQKLSIEFNQLALQAFMQIFHFRNIQEALLNIMTDAHHEKINPELLSPKELQEELRAISHHATQDMKLPLPVNDITHYYRLMSIGHRITENYIIFNVQIPLITPTQFEVLKLTAIPWFNNNTAYKVNLSMSYLLIDLLREHFYAFSQRDFEQCLSLENVAYFCEQLQPLLSPSASTGHCELNILKEAKLLTGCKSTLITDGPHWFALHEPNAWLYAIDRSTTLTTVCNDTLSSLEISGSGILRIGEHCTIKTSEITIIGHTTISKGRYVAYVPISNISEINTHMEHHSYNYSIAYQGPEKEVNALKEELKEFKTISLNTIRPHDVHHYSLGYSIVIILAAIVICMIYKHVHYAWKPSPTPRTNGPTQSQAPDTESHIITIRSS